MISPQKPPDEKERLEVLHELKILHTKYEKRFDRITRMATRIFDVPIALISLVAEDEQWFKSCVGVVVPGTPRDVSFCGHAILGDEVFIVEDALKDERFHDNPLVVGPPHARFYAGRPLRIRGKKIGTLCIMDTKPRIMTMEEIKNLDDLAVWVEQEMTAYGIDRGIIKK